MTDAHRERTLVLRGRSLPRVLSELGARDITSVLIEGGGDVLGQAFDQRLVNEIHFYFAPLLLGGPVAAIAGLGVGTNEARLRLTQPKWETVGRDLCLRAQVSD